MSTALRLFLASRRAYAAAGWIAGTVLVTRIAEHWTGRTAPADTIVALVTALLPAAVIAGGTGDPFGELERIVARPLAPYRIVHIGLLLALGLAAATAYHPASTAPRNMIGLTGIALLTGAALGAQLAWTVPLGYAVVCLGTSSLGNPNLLLWPLLPTGHHGAAALAAGLLVSGAASSIRRPAVGHRHA